jgi:hypothetical protein
MFLNLNNSLVIQQLHKNPRKKRASLPNCVKILVLLLRQRPSSKPNHHSRAHSIFSCFAYILDSAHNVETYHYSLGHYG